MQPGLVFSSVARRAQCHASLRIRKARAPSDVNEKTYSCRNCGKKFCSSSTVIRHRRSCERQFHLTCDLCGHPFYRRDHYQRHLARVHNTYDVMKGFTSTSRKKTQH
ncbi:hypothetical protein V1264_013649 [Littorina saxatilis]|uniref:C2H2-type domain-containing protein n=1 Tax=Littorina saxatilis TaxID=31220 RepID=A0AAN9BTW9_9CAEN